jgi:putative ATPase
LDDIIGQDHIVGQGRLLRRAIQADRISSLIFYGPPGTGKTSLARVIANTTKSTFESLNAALAGIKDVREAVDRATERRNLYGTRTILFVDEVHRWNKAQQDALLPWVENGVIILIGATTENPFFEVNRALVSRSRIFQLKSLDKEGLFETARRALADKERGYGAWRVTFEEGALDHLVEVAGGDARSLLNALELAVETAPSVWPPPENAVIYVSLEAAEQSIQRRVVLYDRDGDYHFDAISAFIKSVRGGDPDAALYWLAKMVKAGEDTSFIFRRMIILASEDIGLADPHALSVVVSCAEAFDRVGFPEGNFPLAHACLYLTTAPKSNSTLAFFDAMKEVEKEHAEVPNHLRDANRDSESFGHGEGYLYPHAYRDHWVAQQYLPAALKGKTFYTPSTVGYEGKIREETLRKREIQAAVLLDGDKREDVLTWSAVSKGREGWFKRLSGGRSALLLRDRDLILGQCSIQRHSRILIVHAEDGLLLWEALRRAPEGLSAACVRDEAAKSALLGYASILDETERPLIRTGGAPSPGEAEAAFSCTQFDYILTREPWRQTGGGAGVFTEFAQKCRKLLAPTGVIVVLQSPPALGGKIFPILEAEIEGILPEAPETPKMVQKLAEAEWAFFTSEGNKPELLWNAQTLEAAFTEAGFSVSISQVDQKEERLLTERDVAAWFSKEKSSWGAFIARELGDEAFYNIKRMLSERAKRGPVEWKWKSLLLKAAF